MDQWSERMKDNKVEDTIIKKFDSPLLESPPTDLVAHENKTDVLNFILDRIFADQLIEEIYLTILTNLLEAKENR